MLLKYFIGPNLKPILIPIFLELTIAGYVGFSSSVGSITPLLLKDVTIKIDNQCRFFVAEI